MNTSASLKFFDQKTQRLDNNFDRLFGRHLSPVLLGGRKGENSFFWHFHSLNTRPVGRIPLG